jgi:hypothetical protein
VAHFALQFNTWRSEFIVSDFHKGVDLISFNLAEMFVVHGQLRLAGQEALNAKHAQQPTLQLIKVAFHA